MGLMKNPSGCGREEFFSSGGRMGLVVSQCVVAQEMVGLERSLFHVLKKNLVVAVNPISP